MSNVVEFRGPPEGATPPDAGTVPRGPLARGISPPPPRHAGDARATELYQETLSICRAPELRAMIPSVLQNLAVLALRRGDAPDAYRSLEESLNLSANVQALPGMSRA